MNNRSTIVIRLIGIVAAVAALVVYAFNAQEFLGRRPETGLLLFYLAVVVLPCFIVVFLVAFSRLWWAFGISLWLLAAAIMTACDEHASTASMILVLATATVCTTPFLNRACGNKTTSRPKLRQEKKMPNRVRGSL